MSKHVTSYKSLLHNIVNMLHYCCKYVILISCKKKNKGEGEGEGGNNTFFFWGL